jgi:hypothetical protein
MYRPEAFMFSGERPSTVCSMTRRECDAIHDQQYRPTHAELRFIETEKHMSLCEFSPPVLLYLRYHPINARLAWLTFYLGSPIEV